MLTKKKSLYPSATQYQKIHYLKEKKFYLAQFERIQSIVS